MSSALGKRLARFETAERPQATPPFDVSRVLFGKQLDFVNDPATFADASCSRRAGKTVGIAAWLEDGPLKTPKAPSLYLTKTRGAAKRIIWPTLLELNRVHRLGYEVNEADLVLKRNGIGAVYLAGVDTKAEIEKVRGTGWGRVAIDEAQSLPGHVKELVEDVLMPSLMDHDGKIRLLGTPGPVPAGYFYDVTRSPDWRHHHWTVWDNPHIPEANKRKLLAHTLKTRGVTEDHPGIQREFFGVWATDLDSLVFRFDAKKNTYTDLPTVRQPWQHVIAIDVGFEDADAIAVIAFSKDAPSAHVVHEWVGTRQLISQLTARVDDLRKTYKPTAIVMDEGGLGKKIAEELRQRPPHLPIKAAEKTQKVGYIELVNDALRTGRLLFRPGSRFADDAMKVEWDRDKSTPDRRVISDRFHSDIADAVLYGFRESMHWTHVAPEQKPREGTPEWYAAEEKRMLEQQQRAQRPRKPWERR